MFAGIFRLTSVVSLAALSAVQAQAFAYTPGSAQYRVTQKTTGTQEAMGQTQDFTTSNDELLTVTLARAAADTISLTVMVDSLNAVGPLGMPVPGVDKLVGRKVVALLSPVGSVYSATGPSDDSVPNGSQITNELSRLLPRMQGRLAAGASWTDTVTGTVRQSGMSVDRRVISTFTVAGDTTVAGEKAWKVTRSTNATLSGGGTTQGQMVSLEGTAAGQGVVLVGRAGTYLGAQSEDHSDIKLTLTAQATDVSIKTTSTTTVARVK